MTLQRLNEIATGMLVLAAGGVLTTAMGRTAWAVFDDASRQQEVIGTVIAHRCCRPICC